MRIRSSEVQSRPCRNFLAFWLTMACGIWNSDLGSAWAPFESRFCSRCLGLWHPVMAIPPSHTLLFLPLHEKQFVLKNKILQCRFFFFFLIWFPHDYLELAEMETSPSLVFSWKQCSWQSGRVTLFWIFTIAPQESFVLCCVGLIF